MKLTATLVLSVQARTLEDAGATLDAIVERARELGGVDLQSLDLATPPGAAPVTIPPPAAGAGAPSRVPHPDPHPHPFQNGSS